MEGRPLILQPILNSTTAQTGTLETDNEFLRLDYERAIQFSFRFSRSQEAASHNTTHNSKQEPHSDKHSNEDQQPEPENIDDAPFRNESDQPSALSLKDHPESVTVRSPP